MYLISKKPGNFGADDVLACKLCEGMMVLTRRSPHSALGPKFEEQRFTCAACEREVFRAVDEQGHVRVGADAYDTLAIGPGL
jgi:hypothetical protein